MSMNRTAKKLLSRVARLSHHPRSDALAVIMYHSIGDGDASSVAAREFDAQMAYLAQSQAVRPLVWGKPLPPSTVPTVLVTFDDGYEDNHRIAAPILREHGIKALFFITSGFINNKIKINQNFATYGSLKPMNWDQVASLVEDGHSIGLHGHTHRLFSQLSPQEAQEEILTSLEVFQQYLGIRPTTFAYPVGQLEHQRRDLNALFEQQHIHHVFTTQHRTLRYSKLLNHHEGVLHIPRVSVDAEDTSCVYREKLFGYWDLVANMQWLRSCIRTRSLYPHMQFQRQ
jgi:peptidoglycan/xylan/chitin deacetylase (PgdA/CDA1 family)